MSKRSDWLPNTQTSKLAMAETWCEFMAEKLTEWSIPTTALTQLATAVTAAKNAIAVPDSSRNSITNAQLKMAFDQLTAEMRDIKKRYLYDPPLTEADFAALGLKPKDINPTPVAPPTGQAEADITYPGRTQLQLLIQHMAGTPLDAKANYGYRIYFGKYAADDTLPATGKDLRESKFSRQKKVLFTFEPEDTGKTAYFCIRYENSKGETGPWGPMFSAVIP